MSLLQSIVTPIESLISSGGSVSGAVAQSTAKSTAATISKYKGSFFTTIEKDAGNILLVIVGVVMTVGALMISQKQTIVNVSEAAAKTAAVVG